MSGSPLQGLFEQFTALLPTAERHGLKLGELALHSAANRGQRLLDIALADSPLARLQLRQLEPGSLAIAVSQPPLTVTLTVDAEQLQLALTPVQTDESPAQRSGTARAALTGSASALLALLSGEPKHSFAGTGVSASGDLIWLGKFNSVLANLDIDWTALLAKPLGNVAAHWLSDALGSALQHGRRTAERGAATAVEVVQQEWQLLPSRQRFSRFSRDLLQLRRDADRLQAKLDYTLRKRQRQLNELQP